MRTIWCFFVVILPLAAWADAPDDAMAANRRLGRGINLGNALEAPREGAWGVKLEAGFFKAIRDAGFDSVRLPVKWSAHTEKTSPFAIDESFARRVDWAIDQALANHLAIVVNVHHFDEMDNDPQGQSERLLAIWKQIAARYKDRPDSVYFEMFNEPHGKFIDAQWLAAIPKVLAAIRETNPKRMVIVGPSHWNGIWKLKDLKLPEIDRRLIVTVHSYEPFKFTHQGASWAKDSDKWKGTKWTGSAAERAAVTKALAEAAAWGKKNNRPIYLGEFGAYQAADMDSRARWTAHVAREAERLGMSWCYWEFCSGFGAYDRQTKSWREPLRAALAPKSN